MTTAPVPSSAIQAPTFLGADLKTVGETALVGNIFGGLTSALGAYYGAQQAQLQLKMQSETYDYQAKMSRINAGVAEQQAWQIARAGAFQAAAATMQAGQAIEKYKVSRNASGIEAGSGSTAELEATAIMMKEIDKLTIDSNTVRAVEAKRMEKVGFQNAASLLGVNADGASASAKSISPFSAVSTSLIGGATSVLNSWYNSNSLAAVLAARNGR
jgi:hypothetical protein